MPRGPKIVRDTATLHFITCASYRQQEKLGLEKHRDLFCQLFEELRHKLRFTIVGYVVMPTMFQAILTEPEKESLENTILTLKQRYQRRYNISSRSDDPAWEKPFTDTHMLTADHILASLNQMHQAPVKAGLAAKMTDWEWSSARRYAGLPEGVVTLEPSTDPRTLITE